MTNSEILRQAIMERRAVVAIGCHDAFSALVAEQCGAEVLQVSGFGLAASWLGMPDVGLLTVPESLVITANIIRAVNIPVMADLDTGGGNVVNAAFYMEQCIHIGAAGANIEDQVWPKRCGHMPGKQVVPVEEMVGKIRACVALRDELDPDFIINARTDVLAIEGLDAAIERCNRFFGAGADLAFIDGIRTREQIAEAVERLDGPLSVNLMDGVTGVRTELVTILKLRAMKVGRVSIPVASIMVVHRALRDFFTALFGSTDGILPDRTDLVTTFEEITTALGLPEIRALEEEFLPPAEAAAKYGSGPVQSVQIG